MKRWKVCSGLVALLIIGTLSLSQAQFNPDTTNFYPGTVIKELFGVFDAIKVGTNLTDAEKAGNSTVVRGGKFVGSNIDAADIDGADIDGGTIDGADLAATNADLNSPDIDGGTIDGTTIGTTTDIDEAEIKLDNRSSDPSGVDDGTIYLNTTVDSLRVRIDGTWRNVGQRGSGYYELVAYTDPQITFSSNIWIDCTSGGTCHYLHASSTAGNLPGTQNNAAGYCLHVKEKDGLSSYSIADGVTGSRWFANSPRVAIPQSVNTNSTVFSTSTNQLERISGVTCFENYGTGS